MPRIRVNVCCIFLLVMFAGPTARADPFRPAFTEKEIDAKASKTWDDPEGEGLFHKLMAFRRPIRIGSILSTYKTLRYLKADAPFPGDPENDDHWVTLEIPPNQPHVRLVTFPYNVRTRALLLTGKRPPRRRRRRGVQQLERFFAERLHNITPIASAQGEKNYGTATGSRITQGTGSWQNTGPIGIDGIIPGEVITEFQPSWFVLAWPKPRMIEAIYMQDNLARYRIEFFEGPDDVDPAVGKDKHWQAAGMTIEDKDKGRWISFAPTETRGIRIKVLSTDHPQIARIDTLHVFTDIRRRPVPKHVVYKPEPVPFTVPYSIDMDGEFTLVVDGGNNRRVRNVFARVGTEKGEHEAHWDLQNELGQIVAPGTYKWKGIAGPRIQLRYEMTPYPNISMYTDKNPPWECGSAGGWLGDHNPAWGVAALGDRVYIGCTGHEAGHGFISCSLTGEKQWGMRGGTRRMIPYGDKTIICENGGWMGLNDSIWFVDVETKRRSNFLSLTGTDERKRGIKGMATANGKIYLTVAGDKRWLVKATSAKYVDMNHCLPVFEPGETRTGPVADLPGDFLRVFRLARTPPGKWGLKYLESTKGKGRRQYTLLAFKEPVPIGSVTFAVSEQKVKEEVGIKLSVLKPDARYPPNPRRDSDWITFYEPKKIVWDVAAAPPNTMTRALLITFSKGGEDELGDLLEEEDESDEAMENILGDPLSIGLGGNEDDGLGEEGDEKEDTSYIGYLEKGEWRGLLEGMTILRRRYKNVFSTAKVHVNSGTLLEDGTWDAQRTEPISPERPGIYAMIWEEPQEVRGLAVKEIDGRVTQIDVYNGPDDQPIDPEGFEHWEQVATYNQKLRSYSPYGDNYNGDALYIDGYADFGKTFTTRAVRLRIVEQWTTAAEMRGGMRSDRGGSRPDPTRCRVYGVAPVRHIGDDVPVDPLLAERFEVWDIETKKLEKEMFFENALSGFANGLVANPKGELFANQGGKIVKVDVENGNHQEFIADLGGPLAMTFDSDGNFYVYDSQQDRCVIRVYDPKGKYQRSIGTPGGKKPGPWDPLQFNFVTGMCTDKDDNLWIVDWNYYPKRTLKVSREGKVLGEFYGSTNYGGNGTMDPWDKSRVFYGPCEFELDWKTGKTRLKNLLWQGPPLEQPKRCIRFDGRDYMTNAPMGFQPAMAVGIIYLFDKDHVKPVAAFGSASSYSRLRTLEIRKQLGKKILDDFDFIWADRNDDGIPQFDEVQFIDKLPGSLTPPSRDLGAQWADGYRYEVREFLPGGVPLYERVETPMKGINEIIYRYDSGEVYHAMDGKLGDTGYNADGEVIWTYKNEGWGVHSLYFAGPWYPGQVVAQFGWIGNETAPKGDLGEFTIMNSNTGAWNIWTSDGLLAGYLLRDMRSPGARWWTMWQHDRGMILKNITAGQEHFSGFFCRSMEDDKFYIIMGGSSVTVAEVIGLNDFKRYNGTFEVTPENVRKVLKWELTRVREARKGTVRMMDCFRTTRRMRIDGLADEWPLDDAIKLYGETEGVEGRQASFGAMFDNNYLYLWYQAYGLGPFLNTGKVWDMLFKSGAGVDLRISTGRETNPNRTDAEAGDKRILMSIRDDEPTVVLYQPVAPNAPPEDKWKVTSPVFHFEFDQAKILKNAIMAFRRSKGATDTFTVEAAIPLKDIGLKIKNGMLLKMDWGILSADESGRRVVRRSYWSNKATAMVSDAPTEARLHPDLWGYIRFRDQKPGKNDWMNDPMLLDPDLEENEGMDGSVFELDF